MAITVGSAVAPGPYSLTVNGTNGSPTASTTIELTVTAASTASSFATYLGPDSATQGAWIGKYGTTGYLVANGASSVPAFASANVTGAFTYTWAGETTDPRALQLGGSSSFGIASSYTQYSSIAFTINATVTDSNTHRMALYMLDWDGTAHSQTITISDAITHTVLDTQMLSGFHNGIYAGWNFKGSVVIKVTPAAGQSPLISGVFFN